MLARSLEANGIAAGPEWARAAALAGLIAAGGLVFAGSALGFGAAERADLAQLKRRSPEAAPGSAAP